MPHLRIPLPWLHHFLLANESELSRAAFQRVSLHGAVDEGIGGATAAKGGAKAKGGAGAAAPKKGGAGAPVLTAAGESKGEVEVRKSFPEKVVVIRDIYHPPQLNERGVVHQLQRGERYRVRGHDFHP